MEETRTASLEEPGIGACSGREFLWETGKKISEKLRLSHIGTKNRCLTNSDIMIHCFMEEPVVFVQEEVCIDSQLRRTQASRPWGNAHLLLHETAVCRLEETMDLWVKI